MAVVISVTTKAMVAVAAPSPVVAVMVPAVAVGAVAVEDTPVNRMDPIIETAPVAATVAVMISATAAATSRWKRYPPWWCPLWSVS